jgi:hypothetical protein
MGRRGVARHHARHRLPSTGITVTIDPSSSVSQVLAIDMLCPLSLLTNNNKREARHPSDVLVQHAAERSCADRIADWTNSSQLDLAKNCGTIACGSVRYGSIRFFCDPS